METSHIFVSKDLKQFYIKRLEAVDLEMLAGYFQRLGTETKSRFGPHAFDLAALQQIYSTQNDLIGFVALNETFTIIIAYSVIRLGYLEHDRIRLQSYGLVLDPITDCTFAPSVADDCQSQGIGTAMFQFVKNQVRSLGRKRMILWGGVQSDNLKAVNYYFKNGFTELGHFEYNGLNTDMILNID